MHTIPARMQQGRPITVEVHVARSTIAGPTQQASPLSLRGELIVARAITVRLRGARTLFAIEAGSPETQWDQASAGAGRAAGEAAVWRFTVTPLQARTADLHVTVGARTLAGDGLIADTGIPEVVVPIRIARDLGKIVRRWAGLTGIAAGSFIAALALQAAFKIDVMDAVRRLAGL